MQTITLIKTARELTEDLRETAVEARIGEVSPDELKQLQKRLDRLTSQVKNPTLSCLQDLREVAEYVDLDTRQLQYVTRDASRAFA
tara:strand:+ start:32860 stop:33117 length:258 start_codon:yes stop_codon:yes gene_type:complete